MSDISAPLVSLTQLFDERIKAAQRATIFHPICLRPELVLQLEQLQSELDKARRKENGDRLRAELNDKKGSNTPAARYGQRLLSERLEKKVEEAQAEVSASSILIKLKALTADETEEYNRKFITEETGEFEQGRTIVRAMFSGFFDMKKNPVEGDVEKLNQLFTVLSNGELKNLTDRAYALCFDGINVPFSEMSSSSQQE